MSALAALRARIATVVPAPAVVADTIPTGIAALDAVLPGGGVPCGRLTEVAGREGSGATTVARALVASALAAQRWVAYIDAACTLAPADWAPLAGGGRLWVVRPPASGHGPWCADLLLRSHAFGLVVLDDATPLPRAVAVRLVRLAQEGHAALVIVHHTDAGQQLVGSALRLHLTRQRAPRASGEWPAPWRRLGPRLTGEPPAPALPDPFQLRRTYACAISKGAKGGPTSVEVHCALDLAHRLRPDSAVPDRRGVATRNRLGERVPPVTAGPGRTTPPPDAGGGTALPRKRRCAEPDIARERFLLPAGGTGGRWEVAGGRWQERATREATP